MLELPLIYKNKVWSILLYLFLLHDIFQYRPEQKHIAMEIYFNLPIISAYVADERYEFVTLCDIETVKISIWLHE